MGRRVALWAVVAGLGVGAVGLGAALRSDGDDDTTDPRGEPDAPAPTRGPADEEPDGNLYRPGDGLPELGGSAPAYRLASAPSEAEIAALARALGVRPAELRFDSFGAWTYSTRGAAGVDTTATTVPVRPAHLPSEAEAKRIAVDLLGRAGVATDDARVQVQDLTMTLQVTVEPRLDGVPAPGLVSFVEVGDEGAVLWASGRLGTPRELAGYDLIDTAAAIDRLNADGRSYGWSVDPWPGPTVVADPTGSTAPPRPPADLTITAAEVVLQVQQPSDGGPGYLVPFYRFTTRGGETPEVAAASDADLARRPG